MPKRFIIILILFVVAFLGTTWANAENAPANDVTKAEFYLKKLEAQAEKAKGQPFKPNYDGQQALQRIKALKEKYPDDTLVEDLFQRARTALMTSKGDFIDITPEMLAYKHAEKQMVALFKMEAERDWNNLLKTIKASADPIMKALPAPSPREFSNAQMQDRYVVLEGFEYPTNQFFAMGREYVFVGSGTAGYYYVNISGRSWLGPYEAVKRYRRLINSDVPEGGPWTMVGKITGSQLAVPQAEKEKTIPAYWGWVVEPVAIYIPGKTFAFYKPDLESGGVFAGEKQMEKIKGKFYTVTEIPDDVAPERLLEIYSLAIKEKNYPLFLECIDPNRKKTKTALSRIRYFWDLHQERFARFYVHVSIAGPAKIEVIKGYGSGGDVDSFFLTDEQKEKVKQISEPMVEEATVLTKAWDERGRQYGSAKPHYLKRVDKKRWYVTDYAQQF